MENTLSETGNFIHSYIEKDLQGHTKDIQTRFPPEPSGYLHIGHAKSIFINFGLAQMYGGKWNLRFDDTNPLKEEEEFVESIIEDIKWLGFSTEGRVLYASDYFEKNYEYAVMLIKKGKAYVCDLTPDQVREYRGTLSAPGKESPYRNRSVEENLKLFEGMRAGEFPDGSRTLRAKIDMASPNINMRDPIIYRIARLIHQRQGDKWVIYPTYDFSHPLDDALEGVTHSICTLEFEDHRPLYEWVVSECGFSPLPRQIEFAKLYLSDTISGKRYIKKLVEDKEVDGWSDPRLITITGMRRRGYTPDAVRSFCEKIGVSKSQSRVDFGMLEYCVRDDLKTKSKNLMAVLEPIKVVITNYPEDKEELVEVENNPEIPDSGIRLVPFSREIYIEKDDFMENAPKKFFRLTPGKEVRLKGAYFVLCTDVIKDENGNITEVHCTYDPETKSGSGFEGRKVKGTIHWVSAAHAVPITAMLYDKLVISDDSAEFGIRKNPDSLKIAQAFAEPAIRDAKHSDRFQFVRNGYFCLDSKDGTSDNLIFNRIVSLRSSYKPE